jgi:hypothetical protein
MLCRKRGAASLAVHVTRPRPAILLACRAVRQWGLHAVNAISKTNPEGAAEDALGLSFQATEQLLNRRGLGQDINPAEFEASREPLRNAQLR